MIRTKEEEVSQGRPLRPARVGVVGDGVTALLTVLALKEWRPELDVALIPTGVDPGDPDCLATRPSMIPFLFGYLGIDPLRLERSVEPTLKLGTRFEWGLAAPSYFNSAFTDGDLLDAQAHDGSSLRYSVSSQLMSAGKAPFAKVGGRIIPLLRDTRFGLHLDTARFTAFLAARARDVGVLTGSAWLGDVELDGGGVRRALTSDGQVHIYDLWIDCSGAPSLLLGTALGVPMQGHESPCDTLVSGVCDLPDAGPGPYSTVTTLEAGWAWHLPLRTEARVGYVHASSFASSEAASAELARRFPGLRDLRTRTFTSGRRRDFMHGNVVAIGHAYAEVEPLACSALHMATDTIGRLIGVLEGGGVDSHRVAAQVAHRWDTLRAYLALHYRFNRRVESPFWRQVHMSTDWSAMEPAVRAYLDHGMAPARGPTHDAARELDIGTSEVDLLLAGSGVVPEELAATTSPSEWHELMAMREALVACALPERETWSPRAEASLWNELVHDERSWCQQAAHAMHRAHPTRGRSQEALAFWTRELGVSAVLGRDAARMPDAFPTSPNIDFGKFLRKVPELVLRPRDQAQLGECLQMCVRRRMPIRVRGAGHSSGGQTLADEGAILDLRWLKRIIAEGHGSTPGPDPHDRAGGHAESHDEHRIRVEAGVWWIELCGHLRAQGRRPLVLTDNWRSTVGGTLAVGGFGDASHREGLQIAGVRELMVMTLDGTRHRARPGDELFDWSLAGRGQLGIITEVVLETIERGYDLDARVLGWPDLARFLEDARTIVAEGRFDWLRARVDWAAGMSVGAAAGHFGAVATRASEFAGLVARQGQRDVLDLFEKSTEEPDERWAMASPGVEVILPVNAAGIAAAHEIARRIVASGLAPALPRGSSIMVLSGRDAQRFPMAPLPTSELVMMLAIRPELAVVDVPPALPVLRGLADLALDAGGKIYLMGLEPTRPGWLATQLGPEHHRHLVELKARWDPAGLLNPGLLP